MAPEVFYSVCYGIKNPANAIKEMHTFTPAILKDYCRHRVEDADYPAVVPEKGHAVRGIYATGITDANLFKLDWFEGSEYDREDVEVELLKPDQDKEGVTDTKKAVVYIFNNPERLEKREWDFEEFRKEKMKAWTRGSWAFGDDGKFFFLIPSVNPLAYSCSCSGPIVDVDDPKDLTT